MLLEIASDESGFCLIECLGYCSELSDDVLAVIAFLEHAGDRCELALSAPESVGYGARSPGSTGSDERLPFSLPGSAVVRAVFTAGHGRISSVYAMQRIRPLIGLSGQTLACGLHLALRAGLLHLGRVPDPPDAFGHVSDQENYKHDDEQGRQEAERAWGHRRRVQTRCQCRVTRRSRRCGQVEGRKHTHHFQKLFSGSGAARQPQFYAG